MNAAPKQRSFSGASFIFALILIWACGLWGARVAFDYCAAHPTGDLIASDPVDSGRIVAGLERTQHFQDTFAWWHGPWVAWTGNGSENSFYRPLTSLFWWWEYQIFGRNGLFGFTSVHIASHLLALTAAFIFFKELAGFRVALIALCFYSLHGARTLLYLPAPLPALIEWKDSPDLWCATAYLFALWCFLRFVRDNEHRWWWGAFIGFITALAFKEMAYTLPILLLLVLWHENKWKSHWRSAIPFFAFAVVAFAFRWWALQGFGFRFGTNGSWLARWLMDVVGGMPAANLSRGDALPLALACLPMAWLTWCNQARPWGRIWLIVAVAAYVATELYYSLTPGDAFWRLFHFDSNTNSVWRMALFTFLLLWLWNRFLLRRSRIQLFAYGWILLTYLPLMTAPITQHAHYFVAFGWALWFAVPLCEIGQQLTQKMKPLDNKRKLI